MRLFRRSSFGWGPSGAGRANPTRGIAVHYQGGRTGIAGFSHDQCEALWRRNRVHHTQGNGWADIGYSFGVCPHGVLEGRGLGRVQAAQPGGNATWYSCTFLTGPGEQPHPNQIRHFRELRAWLRSKGVGGAIRPHSSFVSTACPGDILRRMIRDGTLTRGPTEEDDVSEQDVIKALESGRGRKALFQGTLGYDGIKSPNPDNPEWAAQTFLRAIQQTLAAQGATIDRLVDAVAAGPGVDVEALKAEIREAIESVSVRLEIEEEA